MPDNNAESWGAFLRSVADEADHDADQHDTALALNGQLKDLALSLRAWANTMQGVPKIAAPEEEIADGDELIRYERQLQPEAWGGNIRTAKAALRILLERQHRTRTNTRQRHLSRVLELTEIMDARELTANEALELSQHKLSAGRLEQIDVDYRRALDAIAALDDLEAARAMHANLTQEGADVPAG